MHEVCNILVQKHEKKIKFENNRTIYKYRGNPQKVKPFLEMKIKNQGKGVYLFKYPQVKIFGK